MTCHHNVEVGEEMDLNGSRGIDAGGGYGWGIGRGVGMKFKLGGLTLYLVALLLKIKNEQNN